MSAWTDQDHVWMNLALSEARRGQGRVEPNPMVGAVVADGPKLISIGHHEIHGDPHAEVNALARAGPAARGATLYVTLEPCCHHGKTPPCTDAIIAAGVTNVVAAMRDPFPAVDGGGFRALQAAGIAVRCGLMEEAARRMNAPFLKRVLTGRPYVVAKWAMTLDGKIATATGESKWISNEQSRAWVHMLRGRMDAIVVGIGTVLADDPLLTARPSGPRVATRVVLDSRLRLPPQSRLVATAREAPVLVATLKPEPEWPAALVNAGCEIVAWDRPESGSVSIGWLLALLASRGATNVLVEGGAGVFGHFFDSDEVDAVEVFIAPKISGGDGLSPVAGDGTLEAVDCARLEHCEVARRGSDLHVSGTYGRHWEQALRPVSQP